MPIRDSKKIREYSSRTVRDAHSYPFGLKLFWGRHAKPPRREGELAVQIKHATTQSRQTEIDKAQQDPKIGAHETYDRHNGHAE